MFLVRSIRAASSIIINSNPIVTQIKASHSTSTRLTNMVSYIGTHDGTFHCDDVTACLMLKKLKRFKNHNIVRTRDPLKLAAADIVVDVGGELDVEKLRLDHHQRSFNQTIKDYYPNMKITNPNKPVRLSSSGLVFSVFGKDVISEILGLDRVYSELEDEDKKLVDGVFGKVYIEFFEEIDAIDNGVEVASSLEDGSGEKFQPIIYNYHINSGLSNRVGRLNPLHANATPEMRLEKFHKAMELVDNEMTEVVQFLGKIWWPKRLKFRELVLKRKEFDPSGQVIVVDNGDILGWKSAIFDFEQELGIVGELKYIVYKDSSENSSWRVTCVPVDLKSFQCRVPLMEKWRGKRDEELQEVSGISDANFVHYSGFTGGAKSKEGILSMIRQSLGLE